MKPLIGISMNLEIQASRNMNSLDQDYGKAVYRAGGIPVPILGIKNSIRDLVKQIDGFVFSGGDDIHPRFYGERPARGARMIMSPDDRTQFELDLFKAAYKAKKPILAICGGEQIVNVALGGNLIQDIPSQISKAIKHGATRKKEKVFHAVDISPGTTLSHILGASRINVRSAHHQSVKDIGRGLRLAAQSGDQIIESVETRASNFLIAIQWHPEKTPHDRFTKKLFKALIHASRK
jgi:putative glutamine amidotransferase